MDFFATAWGIMPSKACSAIAGAELAICTQSWWLRRIHRGCTPAQVPSYFPADGAVHITQGNSMMGLDKKLGGGYGRDPHYEQASAAPQHYAQPELLHPQHQEAPQQPPPAPHTAHPGHPPLPPGARRTYRGRQLELAQVHEWCR